MTSVVSILLSSLRRYISRVNPRDAQRHVIVGVQSYKPIDFARQMNVSLANGWGIVRTISDLALKQPEGKYVLVKDPNNVGLSFAAVSRHRLMGNSPPSGCTRCLPTPLRLEMRRNSRGHDIRRKTDSHVSGSAAPPPHITGQSPRMSISRVTDSFLDTDWFKVERKYMAGQASAIPPWPDSE